jgi:hypothetical protein
MKKIKLVKMVLNNFKGVKKFTFEPNGENAIVSAANGIGKTTLKDSYLWCLFGKNAEGDSKFGLRPVDKDNKAIKGLTVSVELTLNIDGKVSVFSKKHKEKIVKKQMKGFTLVCSIDEVDLPITKYDARIAEIIPFDPFKILSDPYYFNNEDKFPWLKRRGVLLELAGELGDPEGFDDLLAALEGRPMDDYKKVLKTRIKAATVRRDEINPRIDENQLKLDDYAETAVDTTKLDKSRHDLIGEIAALDLNRNNIIADQDARQGKIDDINELKDSLAELIRELKADGSAVTALIAEKTKIVTGVAGKQAAFDKAGQAVENKTDDIEIAKERLKTLQGYLNVARNDYKEAKDKSIQELPAIEGVCFNCEQGLPEPMKENAGNERQKAMDLLYASKVAALRTLAESGAAANDKVQGQLLVIKVMEETDLPELLELQDKAEIELTEAEDYSKQRVTGIDEQLAGTPDVDTSKDAGCIKLNEQIATAETDLGDPPADQLTQIEADRTEASEKIEAINKQLLEADAAKAIKPRIDELMKEETEIGQQIAGWESELEDIKNYTQAECLLIESAINGKFKHVKWRLFKELLKKKDLSDEADTVPCCDAMLNGVAYSDMSDGQKIFAGIDIINVLSEHYGLSVPLFIDRAETFTMERESTGQVIELHAVKGVTALKVKVEK